ncbi:DUF305 domain-containing protein [Microbacterium sp. QXD-8]|uniref:DUF305 domain-containing protein n=1 Tax=Microbacterium psychrotolerans TaxID=3068321 RepID=A0ABU0Z4Z4_9MICO|nr:DUF305 domain-containing protein [Microbacterium sp. QXD-8]MDQ7879658.1 DUF305 domain-containing protein [Microbacterium sp. QXD-8]
MRRRAVVIVALALAVATAAAGIALVIAATTAGTGASRGASSGTSAAPSATASPSIPVTADDYCYVEAMIYYRVREQELAQTLLRKEGLDAGASGFATGIAARDEDELADLREWYVSWVDARPVEPPADGPCGGHGADHAQMPGMPAWTTLQGFVDAEHPDAERRFAEILRAQNAGMVALVTLILDGDPHPSVADSAQRVLDQAASDAAIIDGILAQAP